jgi:hypothetical protein
MCWQGFHKRLFSDLTSIIEETLQLLSNQLDIIQQSDIWFLSFAKISINHARATDILGSVFAYLVCLINNDILKFTYYFIHPFSLG